MGCKGVFITRTCYPDGLCLFHPGKAVPEIAEKVLPVSVEKLSQLKFETNVKVKEFLKASPALESFGDRVLSPLRLKPEPPGEWQKVMKDNRGPPGIPNSILKICFK